jgi:uncharacterized coiled-coil protein SlyX
MITKSRHTKSNPQHRYAPGSSRGTRSATTLLAQVADLERGQRIKAQREDLHLTQPAVVDLLEDAAKELPRDHPLHPEKLGKPPVTLRGLQSWEQGGGIAWEKAKLLAAVLRTDVAGLINGTPPEADSSTPDPFPASTLEERLDRMERRLAGLIDSQSDLIEQQNELLARQSAILERIEDAVRREDDASEKRADEEDAWVDRVVSRAREALASDSQSPGSRSRKPAKSGSPRG